MSPDSPEFQAAYPALAEIMARQLSSFAQHAGYLDRRFRDASPEDLAFADMLASRIAAITGDEMDRFCDDYRWLAEAVLEEEIFFRREDRYRLTTFAEANAAVYSDPVYMTRYMNGLLLSQLWWRNHTDVMRYFRDRYLPGNRRGARHLEIGPGHGLFLYFAAMDERTADCSGWDISPASIERVKATFAALAPETTPNLALVDMFEPSNLTFDSLTFSEVLEHLENPQEALTAIAARLAPGGRAFFNVPVNSPAPDHITLFRTPEAVVEVIEAAGLLVEDVCFAPTTGASLDRARKMSLAISTAVIARKP